MVSPLRSGCRCLHRQKQIEFKSVFDQDGDREAELTAAVRNRAAGQSILDALRQHVLVTYLPVAAHPQAPEFTRLVQSTPALRAYAEHTWTRHAGSLSAAIADEVGVDHDDLACATLARYVLEIPALTRARPDRRAAVETIFGILARGWAPPA